MADDRHSTMEEPPEHSESAERSSERLDSWKEIAAYLNRDVTTAQRWEKREGMPVHRHAHERLGSVYAYRAELDAWARSRNVAAEGAGDGPETPGSAFSPDGSLVTFWTRTQDDAGQKIVSIWAVPTLGGEPRPYLEGAAELDWSPDGSQLAYHTTAPGDPLFISHSGARADNHPIFTAPAGLHCHFPLWAPNSNYIYFAEGTPPDGLNIWRIRREGGARFA